MNEETRGSSIIYLGEQNKSQIIQDFLKNNTITKIYIIGESFDIDTDIEIEIIKFSDVILYKFFYRLLQEINQNSLVVLNECLRKTNRYDLSYNCIKRYLLQTQNRIVFNYYPIIKEEKDFMILYDMIQQNPFLKEKYEYITKFDNIIIGDIEFNVYKKDILVDEKYRLEYEKEKEKIISEVKKDADIIPRRLLKFSESINKKYVHQFDSMSKISQKMNVVVNQFKVDSYYYNELLKFKEELDNVIERIQK